MPVAWDEYEQVETDKWSDFESVEPAKSEPVDWSSFERVKTQQDSPSLRPVLSESELGSTTPPRNLAFDVQSAVQEPRLESTGMGELPEHGLLTAAGIGPENIPTAKELQLATATDKIPGIPIPEGLAITAGAKTVAGILDWSTSIEGFPQLVAAMIPGLDLVMAGKFAADMVEGGIVSAEDLGKAAANKDWQGVADASANFIASAYGTKAVTSHAIKTGKARWDRFSERVVPGSVEMPVIGIEKEAQQRRELIARTSELEAVAPLTAAEVAKTEVKPETPPPIPETVVTKEPWQMTKEEFVAQQDQLPLGQGLPAYQYKKAIAEASEVAKAGTPEFDAPYEAAIRRLRNEHSEWQHGELVKRAAAEGKPIPPAEPPKVAEVLADPVDLGAATMESVAPSPTSLKNETGVLERHLHGLPEAYQGETQKMLPAMLRARDTLSKDPLAGSRLAEDLKQNPERGLTGDESALLLQHKDALLKAKNEAASKTLSKDPTIKAEGELAFETASNQLLDLLDALKFRGTQAGRELRWRQALLFEDWSFESMRSDKRAGLGRELSQRENAQIKELHDKIAELEKQLAEKETASTTTERTTTIEESVAEAKSSSKAPGTERDLAGERSDVIDHLKERAQENGDLVGSNASIQKLMELLAREGVTERTAMEQAVHKIIKEIMPDMTLLETQDLMSGYGKYKPLSKDPIKTIVRGIRGEIQQVRKLLDFFSGKAPAKTGVERRIPTQIEHAFIKVVNEAKKAFGTIPTDPAAALKSALDAINTRLKNRLTDLKQEVATRQKIVREKTPSPYNEETLRLRKEIEEVQKQHDEIFGKPELTAAQRLALAEKSADRQIAELEEQLRTGRIFSEGKKPSVLTSDRLEAARAKIEALKEERAAARETIQPTAEPEARMLQQILTRYRNLEASYKDRLARGDFSKRVRKEQPVSDDVLRVKAQLEHAKREFNRGLTMDRMKRRSGPQKAYAALKEALNLPRSFLSSWDVSAVLRQGGFITLGHPLQALKSIRPMFRALLSERNALIVEQEILSRPNAGRYKASKLYLASLDEFRLSKQEEIMMSRFANLVPGVRMSNRAFMTFLNKLRADSFDSLVGSLENRGAPLSLVELEAVSNYINVATGRGNLGKAAGGAETLATAFFSPRLVASRFQLLAGQPLYHGSARTRLLVAGEYGRMLTGLAVVYGLGTLAGADIESDPRSTDFGKLKFDNTRVDPMLGLSQNTVLLSRLATGEMITSKGKELPIRGKIPFGGTSAADLLARFTRTKLAPTVGTTVDVLSGKNVVGEEVTPKSAALNLVTPLSLKDIYDVMLEQGVPVGTAISILSLFGMSVQHYEPK